MGRPIIRKTAEQLAIMREAGRRLREIFHAIEEKIAPGVTDKEIDRLADGLIAKMDATPAFLNYRGFPASICCSINDEVVHGIPSGRRFREGDIVGIDIGLFYRGYCADSAYTYAIGRISDRARRLMDVTRESLERGIAQMVPNRRVGDVGHAIQEWAEAHGYGVVRDFTGHGVGRSMHEGPDCPNYGSAGRGDRLRPGVVVAIEPMINEGTGATLVMDDSWTVKTRDGSLSAHFEHTVAVTEDGPEVLTR